MFAPLILLDLPPAHGSASAAAALLTRSPEERHKLRIALKKLRYTTELFAGLYDADETKRFTQWLKRLQDKAGRCQ